MQSNSYTQIDIDSLLQGNLQNIMTPVTSHDGTSSSSILPPPPTCPATFLLVRMTQCVPDTGEEDHHRELDTVLPSVHWYTPVWASVGD